MKNSLSLGFVLFSLLICGHHALTSIDQDLQNGIEADLIQISSLALKYVSPDVHQNICAKFNPENATTSNTQDESTTSFQNPLEQDPKVTFDFTTPTYLGCFIDDDERMFDYLEFLWSTCSSSECMKHCRNEGYLYAGMQNGHECFCGNALPKPDEHPKVSDDQCDMKCSGNKNEKCGDRWRMSVYQTGNKVYYVDKNGNKVDTNSIETTENYNKYTVTVYVEETPEEAPNESVYEVINLEDDVEKDEVAEPPIEFNFDNIWAKQIEELQRKQQQESDSPEDF